MPKGSPFGKGRIVLARAHEVEGLRGSEPATLSAGGPRPGGARGRPRRAGRPVGRRGGQAGPRGAVPVAGSAVPSWRRRPKRKGGDAPQRPPLAAPARVGATGRDSERRCTTRSPWARAGGQDGGRGRCAIQSAGEAGAAQSNQRSAAQSQSEGGPGRRPSTVTRCGTGEWYPPLEVGFGRRSGRRFKRRRRHLATMPLPRPRARPVDPPGALTAISGCAVGPRTSGTTVFGSASRAEASQGSTLARGYDGRSEKSQDSTDHGTSSPTVYGLRP
jgi:hypothetical protein